MKSVYLTTIALFFSLFLFAQHSITVDEINLNFETTEVLKQYDTESKYVHGYHNEDENSGDEVYAIDIEVFKMMHTQNYSDNIKEATKLIATQLGLTAIEDGGRLPFIKNGYYVLAYDKYDGDVTPVYVIFIKNEDKNEAYETTIYCYNENKKDGLKMAKSFKFLYN